jgi:hypothetical protein
VQIVGAAIDELFNILRELGASSPLGGEATDLLFSGDFAREEEPEKAFWERLGAAGSFGEDLLALRDCLSAETDALLVFLRKFPVTRVVVRDNLTSLSNTLPSHTKARIPRAPP